MDEDTKRARYSREVEAALKFYSKFPASGPKAAYQRGYAYSFEMTPEERSVVDAYMAAGDSFDEAMTKAGR